nr:retrovirus-related Pol polyprotein from transposon TNT 1-94 [Tanacetum cinerariifolium]
MTRKYLDEYTGIKVKQFRDTLLQYMGNVKKSVAKRTRHQRQYAKRVNKRQMQTQENKVDTAKAVDIDLVIIKSSGTNLEVQDDSSRSGNDTDADDADIRPIYDKEQIAEYDIVETAGSGNADHAGCIDSRKSTSGGIQFLGDKLVSWMSKKQNCTAMSSAEAKYVALSSAIAISCNPVQHSHSKNIHTRYHFIKEHVENGIIELYFVRTEYQLTDMFTKALPEDRFKYLVRRIGMRCLTPAELEVLAKESA